MTDTNPALDRTQCLELLDRLAPRRDRWMSDATRVTSHADLLDMVHRLAGFAADRGLAVGERIAVMTRDDTDSAMLFAACVLTGMTVVNLDPDMGRERAHAILATARPALILVDEDLISSLQLGAAGCAAVLPITPCKTGGLVASLLRKNVSREGIHGVLARCTPQAPPADIAADTLAYILFTSGTTSAPKGVCISHRALFSHLATLSRVYAMGPGSSLLNTLMLSHADGMIQGPMLALVNGCTLHRPMRFEITQIEAYLDMVYQRRITHMIAVPTMLSLLVSYGQSRRDAFQGGDFALLVSCGGQLEAHLQQTFTETFGCPLVNVYGLTETVAGGLFAGPARDTGVVGTIGLPIDCTARIVDATGRTLPPGEAGELLMQGDLLMSGYFQRDDLTQEVLRDGWLHTGDMAVQDEQGLYKIIGRFKNIIIRGGFNIHPEEVTEALQAHPQVKEAFTCGLPDAVWGETVAVLVVPQDGAAPSLADLHAHCAARLEPRKIPSHIVFAPELPRGRSGKVVVESARALFQSLASPPRAAQTAGAAPADLTRRVLDIAARCFRSPASQLGLHTTPADVPGWDSLAHIEFIAALEDEFGCAFTPQQVTHLDQLGKALAAVSNR